MPEQRRYGKTVNYSEIYSTPGKQGALVGPTTGRISSYQPVLQNLPMRTEQGRKLLEVFAPPAK